MVVAVSAGQGDREFSPAEGAVEAVQAKHIRTLASQETHQSIMWWLHAVQDKVSETQPC